MAISLVSGEIQITSEATMQGTASAGALTYLDDATKTWTVNSLVNRAVWIKSGTGAGQSRGKAD